MVVECTDSTTHAVATDLISQDELPARVYEIKPHPIKDKEHVTYKMICIDYPRKDTKNGK